MSVNTPTPRGQADGDCDLTQFHGIFFEEAGENLATMEQLLLDIDIQIGRAHV